MNPTLFMPLLLIHIKPLFIYSCLCFDQKQTIKHLSHVCIKYAFGGCSCGEDAGKFILSRSVYIHFYTFITKFFIQLDELCTCVCACILFLTIKLHVWIIKVWYSKFQSNFFGFFLNILQLVGMFCFFTLWTHSESIIFSSSNRNAWIVFCLCSNRSELCFSIRIVCLCFSVYWTKKIAPNEISSPYLTI